MKRPLSRVQLYEKHARLADQLAEGFYLPGCTFEDVRQEARLALWVATGTWRKGEGASFRTWAAWAVKAHLVDRVREARREKRRSLNEAGPDDLLLEVAAPIDAEAHVLVRAELRGLVARRDEMLAVGRRRFTWAESKRRQRAKAAL